MSRSRRKTNIIGIGGDDSEQWEKTIAARKERRHVNVKIQQGEEPLDHQRTFGNNWDWSKDGKVLIDLERNPERMRK